MAEVLAGVAMSFSLQPCQPHFSQRQAKKNLQVGVSGLRTTKISSETYITQAKILKTSTRTEIRFILHGIWLNMWSCELQGWGSCGAKWTEKF